MNLSDVIDEFRGPLMGLFRAWDVPWTDAQDLAQDTFAAAWAGRSGFRASWSDTAAVGRWLRGVARNVHRNWRRSAARRPHLGVADEPEAPSGEAGSGPAAEVRRAIDRLPPKLRAVTVMHYLEETSVRTTAALLGVSEKAVEGRLYQARRRLRDLIDAGATATAGRRTP